MVQAIKPVLTSSASIRAEDSLTCGGAAEPFILRMIALGRPPYKVSQEAAIVQGRVRRKVPSVVLR